MSKFKLSDRQERQTAQLMMKGYAASDELKERVVSAMARRREENERKKALRAQTAKKAAMRVAAFAAIFALVVTATPLRGYVASAAASVHSWTEDVFEVGMKKTKNDCTVRIIEASVANDFLYLTVNETYKGKDDENFHVSYSGTINEGLFNKLAFDDANRRESLRNVFLERASVYGDSPFYDEGNQANNLIKIYIPEIKDFITDADKNYKCKLTADVTDNSGKSLAKLNFSFKLGNVDGVLTSKDVPLDYTLETEDLTFDFEKIEVSGNGTSELFMQITPRNGFDMEQPFSVDTCFTLGNLNALHDNYRQDETAHVVYDSNEDLFMQAVAGYTNSFYTIDGKCYGIFSLNDVGNDNDERSVDYLNYEGLTNPDVNLYLSYVCYDFYDPEVKQWVMKPTPTKTNYFDIIEKYDSVDLKMYGLENRCHQIEDVYVEEHTNNILTLRGQDFVFAYFGGRSGKLWVTCGDDTPNSASRVFADMESVSVAAVKDGKTVFTAVIEGNRHMESTDINYWFNGIKGDITFYNSKGKEISVDNAYAMKYDHLVVTNMNLVSYDDNGKMSYYDSYYNPKYCTAEQCRQDYQAKCDKIESIIIKK